MRDDDEDEQRRRWNDLLPVQTFWQMKAQLNAQDREITTIRNELSEIRTDIRLILASINERKGGWAVLVVLGSVGGFALDMIVRWVKGA